MSRKSDPAASAKVLAAGLAATVTLAITALLGSQAPALDEPGPAPGAGTPSGDTTAQPAAFAGIETTAVSSTSPTAVPQNAAIESVGTRTGAADPRTAGSVTTPGSRQSPTQTTAGTYIPLDPSPVEIVVPEPTAPSAPSTARSS